MNKNGKSTVTGMEASMANKVEQNQQQTQIDLALKLARVAFWEFDLAQNIYILNDQALAVLRTNAEKEGGYTISADEFAQRFIHPDDIPALYHAFIRNAAMDRRSRHHLGEQRAFHQDPW